MSLAPPSCPFSCPFHQAVQAVPSESNRPVKSTMTSRACLEGHSIQMQTTNL